MSQTPVRPVEPGESWIVVLLHGLALAIAAASLLLEHSLPAGTVGAILGTLGAVIVSGFIARSRVRLGVVWLAAAGAATMGLLLGAWLVDGNLGPDLLGPHGAMAAGDLVRFGLLATALALALRTTTARWSPFAVVELAVVALALASVVAAHRDGQINHPRALSDWAWTTGHDPVRILLYIGVGTASALAIALLHEQRGRGARVLLHVGAAIALALLVLLLINWVGLPKPERGSGLGKDGKSDKDDERGKGGKGGKGGRGGGQGKNKNQMDDLQFKNDYSAPQQDSPVAIVLLHDDYSPPLGYYYFRQAAFSQYNGHRLVAATRDDVDLDVMSDFPTRKVDVPDAPPIDGTERKRIDSTVAMLADHVHPFGLESPIEFTPRDSNDPARFTRVYDVSSASLAVRYEELLGKKSFSNSWSDEVRRHYTELPHDPRYKELADKIVNTTLREEYRNDPFAQALAISKWLGDNSYYSLKNKHANGYDPTADFLFTEPDPETMTGRIGYCVHFAHAAAYLLRARGLPARIASGYVADEGRKGSGSAIMLRGKDAHAWAELYLDGFGWIIVDVAPSRTLDPPDPGADRELQRQLGELARGQKPLEEQKRSSSWNVSARDVFRGLLALLLLGLEVLYAIKLWRGIAPAFASRSAMYRVAYRDVLDRLGEQGYVRREGETREQFAERIKSISPSLDAATQQNVGHRYGSRNLVSSDEMRRLSVRAIDEMVAKQKAWRYLLGLLNPFSWMFTR